MLQPEPLLFTFSDGKEALLPLSCERLCSSLVKSYISSPGVTFGGWISSDGLTLEHAQLQASWFKKLRDVRWRLNPYDHLALQSGAKTLKNDETQVLNLTCGFDRVYKRWKKGHRAAPRQAQKAGVLVRSASTLQDWKAYYEVYQDSLNRWGDRASSRYSWRMFSELFKRGSPNVVLWLATYQEKVVAGALCLYAKRHVAYWHGASLSEYFRLRAVNLIIYEAIKDACERGYCYFDFNPSGGHEGVKAFKKHFGTEALPCPIVISSTQISKVTRMLRRKMQPLFSVLMSSYLSTSKGT